MASWDWKKANWSRNLQKLIHESKLELDVAVAGCTCAFWPKARVSKGYCIASKVAAVPTPVKLPRGMKQHHEEVVRILFFNYFIHKLLGVGQNQLQRQM